MSGVSALGLLLTIRKIGSTHTFPFPTLGSNTRTINQMVKGIYIRSQTATRSKYYLGPLDDTTLTTPFLIAENWYML